MKNHLNLFFGQLPVIIDIHLLERVMWPGAIFNVHEFNIKNQSTAGRNFTYK